MDLEISTSQVKALQKRGETFTLLDVREPWELEASRLEGAKHIPMGDIPTRAHQELDPDDHIIVMCSSGNAVAQCGQLAPSAGIRESAIHARWHRRMGAHGGPEGAIVLSCELRAASFEQPEPARSAQPEARSCSS